VALGCWKTALGMSRYLLDTGPVIQHLRGHKPSIQLIRRLASGGKLSIAAMTRIEIRVGMVAAEQYITQKLLTRFTTLMLDRAVADRTGDLIAAMRQRGASIALPDAMIAATALANNLILVTYNQAHFVDVGGLSVYPLFDSDSPT